MIAADTVVVLEGRLYGKPRDREDAKRMLRELSGRTHEVITGVAIQRAGGASWLDAETTRVTFRELDEATIGGYVASGQADDKAGAYGLQEVGAGFVAKVEGDVSNVVGLPIAKMLRGLEEISGADLSAIDAEAAMREAFPEFARANR